MIYRFLIIALLTMTFAGWAAAQEALTHTVKAGETLYRIATTNGMSVDELKRLNGLADNVIHVGQVLRLAEDAEPVSPRGAEPGDDPADEPGADVAAEVDAIDDDVGIDAAGEGADAEAVGEGADADAVAEDADLDAPDDDTPAEAARADLARRGVTTYTVEQGETLYSIAAELGTQAYVLFTLNDGVNEPLEPGSSIRVPAVSGAATYEVRRGDTLSKIARNHGVTVEAILLANEMTSDRLEIGMQLTIPGIAALEAPSGPGSAQRTYAVGTVTVFPETYAGRFMAGGSEYNPNEFVVAHRELPLESVLIVENAATGRASFARVADRGPLDERHLMEISPALASEIGVEAGGRVRVRLVE